MVVNAESALKLADKAEEKADYEEALRVLLPLARAEHAEAQYRVWVLHQDYLESSEGMFDPIGWLTQAALKGHAGAQAELAYRHYGRSEFAKALLWYRKSAEQGNAEAEKGLGDLYLHGYGVPRVYTQAFEHFVRAARKGNEGAQRELGWMYETGLGVPQDYEQAARWYMSAAEQGNASAQWKLGEMLYRGQGLTRDVVEAYVWLTLSRSLGLDVVGSDSRTNLEITLTPAQLMEAERIAVERRKKILESKFTPEQIAWAEREEILRKAKAADAAAGCSGEPEAAPKMTLRKKLWNLMVVPFVVAYVLVCIVYLLAMALVRVLVRGSGETGISWDRLIQERPDDYHLQVHLGCYEELLPALAEILGAEYEPGEFDTAELSFRGSGEKSQLWILAGKDGRLVVEFSFDDDIMHSCMLQAEEAVFDRASRLIRYFSEGDDPGILISSP